MIETHLTTYLRLENKLKDQSIVLQSPLFEIPCHRNGFIRRMANLPVWDVVCHWYSRSRWYSRSQSHWLRLWSFLPVSMCMQNFITIFHSIQAIGPFSHFRNLKLGKASIDDKCHFAIPWARCCQYQCVCKILSKYSKLFKSHGHFLQTVRGQKLRKLSGADTAIIGHTPKVILQLLCRSTFFASCHCWKYINIHVYIVGTLRQN